MDQGEAILSVGYLSDNSGGLHKSELNALQYIVIGIHR